MIARSSETWQWLLPGLLCMLLGMLPLSAPADEPATISRLSVKDPLDSYDIIVARDIDTRPYRRALLVKVDEEPGELTNYFRISMQQLGFFTDVYDEATFRNVLEFHFPGRGRLFQADSAGIKMACGLYGPFLAARLDWENRHYLRQLARISVYEPATGELVFQAEHRVLDWSNIETELFNPLLNAFQDWLEANSTTP